MNLYDPNEYVIKMLNSVELCKVIYNQVSDHLS